METDNWRKRRCDMQKKKFDDATEREIYDAYRTGEYVFRDLADKYGCCIATISTIVSNHDAKNGVITPRHQVNNPALKRFDHDTEREIYNAYRTGKYVFQDLADKYGCCVATIYKIVSRHDAKNGVITPRNRDKNLLDRGRLSLKLSNKKCIEMYVARRRGATCRQLEERYGISDSCVCEISKRIEKAARERGLKI